MCPFNPECNIPAGNYCINLSSLLHHPKTELFERMQARGNRGRSRANTGWASLGAKASSPPPQPQSGFLYFFSPIRTNRNTGTLGRWNILASPGDFAFKPVEPLARFIKIAGYTGLFSQTHLSTRMSMKLNFLP
jgi:hypothetical protein